MAKTAARRKPTKPKARKLAPRTKKADVSESRGIMYIAARPAGVRVNEDTALTLGAVWACVKVIGEDIAGLPWHVMEQRVGGGSTDRTDDPADWIISTQASPEMPAFQFRETMLTHALTWGNGYAEIERDGAGRPLWLWLITPDRVTPMRTQDGRLVYEVNNPRGGSTYLESDDMFHLRGLGFDGLMGYSVIQLAARSIGAGIALDQSTADLFGNDSTPGGLLTHPTRLSDQARNNLRDSWNRMHQGPTNRRKVAILEEGMDWKQTGLPPEDTKLIEQRQFTPADVCRWFRVSPVKIQDLLRATFSNIEELAIWHVTDTLLPWVRRLETEANIKLFGRTNRGKRFTKLNLKGLLRGNTAAQTEHISAMMGWGVYDVDEGREYLDLNPIGGEDGAKRFVPVNMQLLEKAGEDPPEPPPTQPGGNPNDPNGNPPDAGGDPSQPDENPSDPSPPPGLSAEPIRAALLPVFEDACRRLLRRESQLAGDALKRPNLDVPKWMSSFERTHVDYIRNTLGPAVSALAISRRASPEMIDAALGVVAERNLGWFKIRFGLAVEDHAAIEKWESLANDMAEKMIDRLSTAVEVSR